MRFYQLDYSNDLKIVGSQYPQVWDFVKGYSPENDDNGVFSLYYENNPLFPPTDPDLSGFKLANGAHYTDFLSHGFFPDMFFLSENAKKFLENQNIESHRFYKGKVTSLRKKRVEAYYVMKLVSENWRYVDYPNSKFYVENTENDAIVPIEFNSCNDFIQKSKQLKNNDDVLYLIFSDAIKMTEAFYQKNLDMFMIDEFNRNWFVSERFVDDYYKNKFTGLDFKSVDI